MIKLPQQILINYSCPIRHKLTIQSDCEILIEKERLMSNVGTIGKIIQIRMFKLHQLLNFPIQQMHKTRHEKKLSRRNIN